MKYIKVASHIYTDPNVAIQNNGLGRWEAARPELLETNLWERLVHRFYSHFTFGQPFCVVCGRAELTTPPNQ
jgi:hypothetical protein